MMLVCLPFFSESAGRVGGGVAGGCGHTHRSVVRMRLVPVWDHDVTLEPGTGLSHLSSLQRGGEGGWQNAGEILYYLSRSKKRVTGSLHLLVFPHGRITEANILLEHHDIVSSHTATTTSIVSYHADKPLVYDHLLLQKVETTGSRGGKRVEHARVD